jgi:methionine aminopeptidase
VGAVGDHAVERRADVVIADDEWTISTADGSLSAHYEHTVAITGDGPRILTERAGDREFAGLLP